MDRVRVENPVVRPWIWAASVLVSGLLVIILASFPGSGSDAPGHWGFLIAVAGYGMVIPLVLIAFARRSRGEIEITAEGIRLTDDTREVHVPWNEVNEACAHSGPYSPGITFTGPQGRIFISASAEGFQGATQRIRAFYPVVARPALEYRRRNWLSTLAMLLPYCCMFAGFALSAWLSNESRWLVAGFLAFPALGILLIAIGRAREPYHVMVAPGRLELRSWLKHEVLGPTHLDLAPVKTGEFTRLILRASTDDGRKVDVPIHRENPFEIIATALHSA